MSVNGIATYLIERMNSLEEETTSANISFLPGGFTTVAKSIASLAKHKKDWKIEVRENGPDFHMVFEDQLNIKIAKKHWNNFVECLDGRLGPLDKFDMNDAMVRASLGRYENDPQAKETFETKYRMEADITEFIREATDEITGKLVRDSRLLLHRSFREQPFVGVVNDIVTWERMLGRLRYVNESSTLLQRQDFEGSLRNLFGDLAEAYKDDIGGLQMLAKALKEKTSLADFEPFSKYQNLFGTKIQSRIGEVMLEFESVVDISFKAFSVIRTKSSAILEGVKEVSGVSVKGCEIESKFGIFTPRVLREIRDVVEDLEVLNG